MKYNNPYVKKHTVASTAVALDFDDVGFSPSYVKIINVTKKRSIEHIRGMNAASGFVVKEGDSSIFSPALDTSTGITLHDRGFLFGINTDVNVATDVLHIIAY